MSARAVPVSLIRCVDAAGVPEAVGLALDHAGPQHLRSLRGARVLVKPNLLAATPLACTDPAVTAAACAWLLDNGAHVAVADSPGFGRAEHVARVIGLTDALAPLGIVPRGPSGVVPLELDVGATVGVAREIRECDLILSVPRVKAHSQVRLTLAVKNLYGVVAGLRKAFIHTRQGRDPLLFADTVASLWAALPPAAALADGVIAMHVDGPSRGRPFPLGLVGASPSAPALDEAVCAVLGIAPADTLVGAALERRSAPGCAAAGWTADFADLRPEDFDASGFVLPDVLMHTSFRPGRLLISCLRRLLKSLPR